MIVDIVLVTKERMAKDNTGLNDERTWGLRSDIMHGDFCRSVAAVVSVECECSVGSEVPDFDFFKVSDVH
jgi:hypothetical protein